jgi:hypothetical protein
MDLNIILLGLIVFVILATGAYAAYKIIPTMKGQTPMTKVKGFAIIGAIMLILMYGAYLVLVPHNVPESNGNFVSGQIIAGNGYVTIETVPMANAQPVATPTPVIVAPTVKPTVAPIMTPTPGPTVLAADGNIHYGQIIYVEKPTVVPKPIIGENSQYINQWNYFKGNGLNVQYPLKENMVIKGGSTYNIPLKITNTRNTPADHVVATLTVSTLEKDSALNIIPIPPQQIYNEYKSLAPQDTLDMTRAIPIPNYKGHYKLYLTINCDNGANAEIMQEITIN